MVLSPTSCTNRIGNLTVSLLHELNKDRTAAAGCFPPGPTPKWGEIHVLWNSRYEFWESNILFQTEEKGCTIFHITTKHLSPFICLHPPVSSLFWFFSQFSCQTCPCSLSSSSCISLTSAAYSLSQGKNPSSHSLKQIMIKVIYWFVNIRPGTTHSRSRSITQF